MCLSPLATITRMMRASTIEVLQQDYVLTERALGLSQRLILFKYVLRNAVSATLTVIGLYFGWLLGGTVLVETVFDWPGLGLYATKAVVTQDFMPVIGVTLVHRLHVRCGQSDRRSALRRDQSEGALRMTVAERSRQRLSARREMWRRERLSLPPEHSVHRRAVARRSLLIVVAVFGPLIVPYPDHVAGGNRHRGAVQAAVGGALVRHQRAWPGHASRSSSPASRVSLFAGLAVVVLGALVGTFVGAIAGYFGGWTDDILMRLADLKLTIPGSDPRDGGRRCAGARHPQHDHRDRLSWWPGYARLVRGEVMAKKEEMFVTAALRAWRRPGRHSPAPHPAQRR